MAGTFGRQPVGLCTQEAEAEAILYLGYTFISSLSSATLHVALRFLTLPRVWRRISLHSLLCPPRIRLSSLASFLLIICIVSSISFTLFRSSPLFLYLPLPSGVPRSQVFVLFSFSSLTLSTLLSFHVNPLSRSQTRPDNVTVTS